MALSLSASGMEILKDFEGFRSSAYLDSKGIPTIGYGTIRINGQPVRLGMTCTMAQALEWKRQDLARFLPAIERLVKVPLTQNQVDALVCFVYNVGEGGFASSSLLRAINARQPITEDLFTRWNKISERRNGRKVYIVVPGLTSRRKAEYRLFMKG